MTAHDAPSRETLDGIKRILRGDLQLGAGAEIPDDAPLIGSEAELDSLDILLLVSSIEKTFGLKIPNDQIDEKAFRDVTSLARFVEARRGMAGDPDSGGGETREPGRGE